MKVQVVTTASKFPQVTMEAPSSVTVIAGNDVRRFGYRTLADALRTVRGFARPGDYNTRAYCSSSNSPRQMSTVAVQVPVSGVAIGVDAPSR